MSVESELKALCVANSTLTAIISNRIYHVSPSDLLAPIPRVSFESLPGGSQAYHALQGVVTAYETIYRFHAFAKNTTTQTGKDICITICNAINEALHGKTGTLIRGVFVDGAPTDAEVEDTENVAHRVIEFRVFHI